MLKTVPVPEHKCQVTKKGNCTTYIKGIALQRLQISNKGTNFSHMTLSVILDSSCIRLIF